MTICVGFDLDMTLIDSRSGVADVMRALAAETGTYIDVAAVVNRLGPPLEQELAHWYPAAEIPAMAERYRELYTTLGVRGTESMPGATDAIAAVNRAGGRAVVVSAKSEGHAVSVVERAGLAVDAVTGSLFGTAKGEALRAYDARVYVGDHLGDVDAAHAADAVSAAVATGMYTAGQLYARGADVVFDALNEFGDWLVTHLETAA